MWMRDARLFGLLGLLALAGLGCGAGDAESGSPRSLGQQQPVAGSDGPHPWVLGGQTGALSARCGLSPAAAAGAPVPAGDAGFVVYTDGCSVGQALPSDPLLALSLLDEQGEPVAFTLEMLDDGTSLVRPAESLPPGVYMLQGLGQAPHRVVVGESEPLPMTFGTVASLGPTCGADFRLALDPGLLPYVPQLKLTAQVDTQPPFTWFDFGTLAVVDGVALASLPACEEGGCPTDGEHRLTVTPELAGELGTLELVEVVFQVACGRSASSAGLPAAPPPEGEAGGCALAGAAQGGAGLWLGLLGGLLLAGGRRRARKRRRRPRGPS